LTYHNPHSRTLDRSRHPQQQTHYLPPLIPLLLPPKDDDRVGDQRRALDYHGKRHQEANAAPQAAEGAVVPVAVFVLREVGADACQRGAALVQAVAIVDFFAGGLEGLLVMIYGSWRCARSSD